MIRRAVAPVEGMKGGLRSSRSSRGRRGVQGRSRPAQLLHAIDWGYVGFVLAVAATAFVLVFVALERAA